MTLPPEFRRDADRLPPLLRDLLDAELAAGNSVAEVGYSFPAPPAGAYFKLTAPVTTRPREAGGGLSFRALDSSLYSGFFGDESGFYFIVEPPLPPPPDPGRFERGMAMNYEKWHDGIGYDLAPLRGAGESERRQTEALLLARGIHDWRDVEALAALATPAANSALLAACLHPDPEIRLAVMRYAPHLATEKQRAASLVQALRNAEFMGGLSQALDEAAGFHPREVVDELLHGALHREGEAAVHFAALLMFIHGQAASPFDWDQRPFFLRFGTEDRTERRAAFRELCERIGHAEDS